MPKQKKYEHDLKVDFGGVTIGDHSAAVGITFDRNGHSLDDIDAMLCGKRLEVFAIVGEASNPAQQQLEGMEGETHPHIEATCDSPSLRVTPKLFSGRLSFSLNEIGYSDIGSIAKRKGTLRLNVLGAIPEKEPAENPRQQKLPPPAPARQVNPTYEAWANTPIDELANYGEGLPAAKIEALKESELEIGTIGRLTKVIETDPQWHRKVRGLGPKWIDRLSDCLAEFLKVNPAPDGDGSDEEPSVEQDATQASYPDRNSPGGPECGSVSFRRTFTDEEHDAEITVAVGIVDGNRYISCLECRIGNDRGGRDTPRADSEPHETAADAAVQAINELVDIWLRAGGARQKVAAKLAEWRDDVWPSAEEPDDDDLPAAVPFETSPVE